MERARMMARRIDSTNSRWRKRTLLRTPLCSFKESLREKEKEEGLLAVVAQSDGGEVQLGEEKLPAEHFAGELRWEETSGGTSWCEFLSVSRSRSATAGDLLRQRSSKRSFRTGS